MRFWWLLSILPLMAAARVAADGRPSTAGPPASFQGRLGLELAQGALIDHQPRHGFGWTALLQLAPGFAYDQLEVNALVSAMYTNPLVDLGLGGRVSYPVLRGLAGTFSLRVGVESQYMFRAQNARLAFGIVPGLGALLRMGLWAGRDFERGDYYVQIVLGTDLTTLRDPIGAIIAAGPMQEDKSRGR